VPIEAGDDTGTKMQIYLGYDGDVAGHAYDDLKTPGPVHAAVDEP
jgi:hypothetical protein